MKRKEKQNDVAMLPLKIHLRNFEHKLQTNDYPRSSFTTDFKHNKKRTHRQQKDQYFYLKFPFISNNVDNKIKRIFNKEGIPLRLAHRSLTLRNYLSRNSNTKICTLKNCPLNNDLCMTTGCVYKIECGKCHAFYIGSTKRKLHTRLQEHLKSSKSPVHQHFTQSQPNNITTQNFCIKTTIVDRENDHINLRFLESLQTKRLVPTINTKEQFHFIDPLIFWLQFLRSASFDYIYCLYRIFFSINFYMYHLKFEHFCTYAFF